VCRVCAGRKNRDSVSRAVYNHRSIAYLLRKTKRKIKGKIIDCVGISYPLNVDAKGRRKNNKLRENKRHLYIVF